MIIFKDNENHNINDQNSNENPIHNTIDTRTDNHDHNNQNNHNNNNNNKPILNDISIRIEAGDRVAIVGRSGSGKTSFINILLNLYPYLGTIEICNVNIQNILKSKLRSYVSCIAQQPLIFTSTLRDNIDPYNEYSNDELLLVIKQCQLYSLLHINNNNCKNNSQKNETINSIELNESIELNNSNEFNDSNEFNEKILAYEIIDNGSNLSQGQKQLICVARILLKKTSILLIDEATASIDPITEALIYQLLTDKCIKEHITVLCICHKLASINKFCNKLLHINNGNIIKYENFNFNNFNENEIENENE